MDRDEDKDTASDRGVRLGGDAAVTGAGTLDARQEALDHTVSLWRDQFDSLAKQLAHAETSLQATSDQATAELEAAGNGGEESAQGTASAAVQPLLQWARRELDAVSEAISVVGGDLRLLSGDTEAPKLEAGSRAERSAAVDDRSSGEAKGGGGADASVTRSARGAAASDGRSRAAVREALLGTGGAPPLVPWTWSATVSEWPLLAPVRPSEWVPAVAAHGTACLAVVEAVREACLQGIGIGSGNTEGTGIDRALARGVLSLGAIALGSVTAPAALLAATRQAAAAASGVPVSQLYLQCRAGSSKKEGAGEGDGDGGKGLRDAGPGPASLVVPQLTAEGAAWDAEAGGMQPSASLRNAVHHVCLWWSAAEGKEEEEEEQQTEGVFRTKRQGPGPGQVLSIPLYANSERRETVAVVSLPVTGALSADAWSARLVALLAWGQ